MLIVKDRQPPAGNDFECDTLGVTQAADTTDKWLLVAATAEIKYLLRRLREAEVDHHVGQRQRLVEIAVPRPDARQICRSSRLSQSIPAATGLPHAAGTRDCYVDGADVDGPAQLIRSKKALHTVQPAACPRAVLVATRLYQRVKLLECLALLGRQVDRRFDGDLCEQVALCAGP